MYFKNKQYLSELNSAKPTTRPSLNSAKPTTGTSAYSPGPDCVPPNCPNEVVDSSPYNGNLIIKASNSLMTFKNEGLGYEFNFPKQWNNVADGGEYDITFFNEDKYAKAYAQYLNESRPLDFYDNNNGYADINIGAYEKGQTVGPTPGAHTIVDEDTDLQSFVSNIIGCVGKDKKLSEISVGNQEAYECSMSGQLHPVLSVYLKLKGNILVIAADYGDSYKTTTELQNTFSTILSSFRFF